MIAMWPPLCGEILASLKIAYVWSFLDRSTSASAGRTQLKFFWPGSEESVSVNNPMEITCGPGSHLTESFFFSRTDILTNE